MKKKLLIALGLLASLTGLAKAQEARFFDVPTVRYKISVAANVSTTAVVLDLSDTTNWPHKRNRELQIYNMHVYVDKAATSTETLKLGVVTQINDSTGSVKYFYGQENSTNSANGNATDLIFPADTTYNLRVVTSTASIDQPGTTPFLMSNDTNVGSTVYQTDVFLPSPNANTKPGVGDVILDIVNGTGVITVYVEMTYQGGS